MKITFSDPKSSVFSEIYDDFDSHTFKSIAKKNLLARLLHKTIGTGPVNPGWKW